MADPVPLLAVRHLKKHYPVRRGVWGRTRGYVRAVDGVDFDLWPSETLGLVGESGCGKSTLGRLALGLLAPSAGNVYYDGEDLAALGRREFRALRRRMQIVFQDPFGSLNPRLRVGSLVGEGLKIHRLAKGAALEHRVRDLLEMVGLSADAAQRFPHEFSGGQRQRIGIARALALEPQLVVADEPVSALDVSVQAQIVNLLQDLQGQLGLAYLFIAHDLSVVRHICDRVAVMYLGRIVELAEGDQLYRAPAHPYSRALLAAVPALEPRRHQRRPVLGGDVPNPAAVPSGCPFHPRCPERSEVCVQEVPPLVQVADGRQVACHLYKRETSGDPSVKGFE